MQIDYHRRFLKEAGKLEKQIQAQLAERIKLFRDQPDLPLLNRHRLKGEFFGFESINVSGDVRAIYRRMTPVKVQFVRVGTHSKLYKE